MDRPTTDSVAAARVSVETLAALLNLTSRRIHQLVKERVIPRASRGKYDLGPAVAAYVAYLQRLAAQGSQDDLRVAQERARKLRADAELAELDLAERRGVLVPVDRFELAVGDTVDRVRQRLLALPGRGALRTVGLRTLPEAQAVWEAVVHDLLRELAAAGDDGAQVA